MTGRNHTRGISPLVEAVTKHKGDWSVSDITTVGRADTGMTDNSNREMWVPLDNEPCHKCGVSHGHAIRGHEALHAKLSPEYRENTKVQVGDEVIPVSADNIEAAEEYRINYSLAKIEGVPVVDDIYCPEPIKSYIGSLIDQGRFDDLIRYAIAGGPGMGGLVYEGLANYLDANRGATSDLAKSKTLIVQKLISAMDYYQDAAKRIMFTTGTDLPAWRQVEELAAYLEVNLRNLRRQIGQLLADARDSDIQDMMNLVEQFLENQDAPKGLEPEMSVDMEGGKPKAGKGSGGSDPNWGEAHFVEVPLTESLPAWKLQKRNRAVDEGTIPRYMHRWPTDKRVFHRSKRVEGGTVLVDVSGSMHLTVDQIDDIIETIPAGTIATYSGNNNHDGTGQIRIVAKDGKRAKAEDLRADEHELNVIDGPALEWLGDQSYPRIWVSDGLVTDRDEDVTPIAVKDAKRLVRQNRITRVEDANEALDRLKRGDMLR